MKGSSIVLAMSLLGIAVAGYALYVEHEAEMAQFSHIKFEALCDTAWGSCSRVFTSPFAHILSYWGLVPRGSPFDLSLAFLGFAYYSGSFIILSILKGTPLGDFFLKLLAFASSGSLFFSLYLAYILKVVLKDFCIVCASMYVVNFGIWAGSVKAVMQMAKRKAAAAGGKKGN